VKFITSLMGKKERDIPLSSYMGLVVGVTVGED
jgi:hypothetical protein